MRRAKAFQPACSPPCLSKAICSKEKPALADKDDTAYFVQNAPPIREVRTHTVSGGQCGRPLAHTGQRNLSQEDTMAAPTVSDYALLLLKPNILTQSSVNPLDFVTSLLNSSQNTAKPKLDPLDIALTGRMRADVGTLEVSSKNMTQGAAAMKTTLEPLTRLQTLLGEMANLTDQASTVYGSDSSAYEAFKTQYETKAQEVSNLVRNTTFNGIPLLDGASWQSDGSSVVADYRTVTDENGVAVREYSGTGRLNIHAGNSNMSVVMIDFGSTAKNQGTSLVDLTNDAAWMRDTEVSAPPLPGAGATAEEQAAYTEARAQYEDYVTQYNATLSPDIAPLDPTTTNETFTIKAPAFSETSAQLFKLQDIVGMAIARYGAFNSSMERQSAMYKGQSEIVQQAVTNQLSGSKDLESLTLDLLRSSIISGRG